MSGRGQFGHVKITVYPGEPGSGFVFENRISPGTIPTEFIPAIEQGLVEAASGRFPPGYVVRDVRIELNDGSYHDVDSSETTFKLAARMAFEDAVRKAGPIPGAIDGGPTSGVREPRHPRPAIRNSTIAVPEPDEPE